jgi:hypothetical protein
MNEINDGFLNFMYSEYLKDQNMEGGNRYWNQIKRDFSNVMKNDIPCYIHMARSGVFLYDGYQYQVRKLLGYMVANDIVVFSGGNSVGYALKQMGRNEKDLNFILNGNEYQMLREITNWVGLMRSKSVKLNAFNFIRDMYSWKAQETNANKNWVRKMWVRDYMGF